MPTERPIEIEHLPPKLHSDFDALVPIIDTGTQDEKEANFCSRALAAYTVQKLSGCTTEEAAESIVDGGGDGGIDAVHFTATSSTLWCVQSKFIREGRGEPSLGDVSKFADGIEALLRGEFGVFEANDAWGAKLPAIKHHLQRGGITVRAILVYSGITLVSEDRRIIFQRLEQQFAPEDEFLRFQSINLTTLNEWIAMSEELRTIPELDLCLRKPGWVRRPHEMVYGLIPLSELHRLVDQHGDRLVASNLRKYKGRTEVNEQISDTVVNEPDEFLYVNNGLTAYCNRLEVRPTDRANAEEKHITATGFSIVNGAQTLGALRKAGETAVPTTGNAFIRVVSMERCEDERAFSEKITKCTNTQNEILTQDYIALDPEQERIATQLAPSNVTYHFKSSEDSVPLNDSNFTLKEATTAAAALVLDTTGDIQARILGNRKSLWDTHPEDDEDTSRYARVFSTTLSARSLWRTVQAQREALEKLRELARAEPQRKPFFENARWIILNILFMRTHPDRGEAVLLTTVEKQEISDATITLSELVWDACRELGHVSEVAGGGFQYPRHFRSVFSGTEDCRRIRAKALQLQAQADQPAPTN